MKYIRFTFCVLLCALLTMQSLASALAADDADTPESVVFGSYPQQRVTHENTLRLLDGLEKNWQSYNYYTGTGVWDDGQMAASDFMQYADLTLGTARYRAVRFSAYRPQNTGKPSPPEQEKPVNRPPQAKHGYMPDTVYYFSYAPIRWRVLDKTRGLVMSETILDAQPFQSYVLGETQLHPCDDPEEDPVEFRVVFGDEAKTRYASSYDASDIRRWLNDDFFKAAFNPIQRTRVQATHLDNPPSILHDANDPAAACNSTDTDDKVFLLSYNDMLNPAYGFISEPDTHFEPARILQSTDYAKCMGLEDDNVSSNFGYSWLLRTPYGSQYLATVLDWGDVSPGFASPNTLYGIVPALHLSPAQTLTVTLDPNGGTLPKNEPGVYTVTYGERYLRPVYVWPERKGCIFEGWYDDSGRRLDLDAVVDRTDDHTLTAHWRKPIITIRDFGDGAWETAYGESLTFTADVMDGPEHVTVQWYKDGQYFAKGDTCTVEHITQPFTMQAKLFGTSAESETLQVVFTPRSNTLGAYFRRQFPVLTQAAAVDAAWLTLAATTFLSMPFLALADKLGADGTKYMQWIERLEIVAAKAAGIVSTPFVALVIVFDWLWKTMTGSW